MSHARESGARDRLAPAVWATLAAAALVYQGYNLAIGLGSDDTNHLESTLILAIARQVTDGPGTLYGPFSGANPLVLIHAPLYYRLAALAAWPLARMGLDPVTAAMAAGRGLSWLAMAGALAAAGRLARADGAPARAGVWSALLIAAAPVFGSFPVTVRPDTLAIALQTAGVALALGWLRAGRPGAAPLLAAYAAFGLALGARQNFAVSPAITSAVLLAAGLRGRARIGPIAAAHALGAAVVLGYYGLEQAMTGGAMARSVFGLAGALRTINYASWGQVAAVAFEVAKESIGLIALAAACAVAIPGRVAGSRLDALLWAYLAGEAAAMIWLCLNSTGSWVNYAMPPVVYAAVLVGRALDRALRSGAPCWRLAPIVAAGLVLLAADARYAAISARSRAREQGRLRALFADEAFAGHPSSERYFVARPHYNRMYGRPDLAHDDWLYSSFEAARAAEPRSRWLKEALVSGPVRLVVVALEPHRDPLAVEGLDEWLPALGYRRGRQYGNYVVWERR